MKANLLTISSVVLAVLLFCLGCEPEPDYTPQKTESAEQLSGGGYMSSDDQQIQQEEMEIEMAAEQQPEPETEMMNEEQAETEKMIEQPAETEMVMEQTPEPEPMLEQPAETKMVMEQQPEAETMIEQPVEPEPEEMKAEQTQQPSPDDIIVTVNGTQIKREKLDKYLEPQLEKIKASRKLTDEQLADITGRLTRRLTEVLIYEAVIEQQMKERNVVVTEQQIEEHIKEMAERENMTVDDLKAIVTRGGGTFEDWKERMQFDKVIGVLELAKLLGLGTADVNETDALEYYRNNPGYKIPEQVRASHILITPEKGPGIDAEAADRAAKEKAQQLLEQIKNGADFAQLARENSDCPSAPKGGDLGFARRQSWVAPFSNAAFALETGQVSDVVKTRFGYHIIKVTDRKEPSEIPFENVKETILKTLRTQKESDLSAKCVESLKNKADIVYAEGYGPEQTDEAMPQ